MCMIFHCFNLYLDKTQHYHLTLLTNHQYSFNMILLADNVTALYKARQAFISSKSSGKIWRALNNNVWTSKDTKYETGDGVCFKNINEKRWKDPRKVLGLDGQQVLVKYGNNYVRVHRCWLSLARTAYNN